MTYSLTMQFEGMRVEDRILVARVLDAGLEVHRRNAPNHGVEGRGVVIDGDGRTIVRAKYDAPNGGSAILFGAYLLTGLKRALAEGVVGGVLIDCIVEDEDSPTPPTMKDGFAPAPSRDAPRLPQPREPREWFEGGMKVIDIRGIPPEPRAPIDA